MSLEKSQTAAETDKTDEESNGKDQIYYFKYFTLSAIVFLVGLGSVVYVNLLLPASEKQEWLALIGLILSVPSGLLAFYCYLRILISRFQSFMDK